MAKEIIGIDISDFSIEAVVLDKKKNGFKLKTYSRFRLSPEIVEDGRILDRARLKEALAALLKNASLSSMEKYNKVIISIPQSKIFSKVFSLPKNLKEKEIVSAVYNQAESFVPYAFDQLKIALKFLPAKNGNKEVLFFACPADVLADFSAVFAELGLAIESIVPEAVSSFVGLAGDYKKSVTLLLDLGARTTIASIFNKNGIRESININIGGNAINQALVNRLGVSYTTAEDKKRNIGLTAVDDGQTMLVIQGQLQPLADELKIFIAYYNSQNQAPIEQVVLIGGLAQMKGLDKYFGENLSLPAYVGSSLIDSRDLPSDISAVKYINALGLAVLAYQKPELSFVVIKPDQPKGSSALTDDEELDDQKQADSFWSKAKSRLLRRRNFAFLLLLLLAILLLVFRDHIYSIFQSKSPLVQLPAPSLEQPVRPAPTSGQFNFTVGSNPDNSRSNFILGEYHHVSINRYKSDPQADYYELMDLMEQEARSQVLGNLDAYVDKSKYGLAPLVLDYEIVQANPQEDDFVIGQSTVLATFRYQFLVFSWEKLADLLVLDSDWRVLAGDLNRLTEQPYELLNYSVSADGALFNFQLVLPN
ncbi:MAG: pilus assembly protein PilM [Patescibacteria group bacterium]|nr:pilus assembly protein PilM [Patescibacteria group bacterium]